MSYVAEQLEKLAALVREGLLTREEYNAEKTTILSGRAELPAAHSPSLPEQIGAYRILGLIGEGGMGSVYRGRHRSGTIADRQAGDVAVKVMHAQFARNPTFQARFEREAGLGLKLDHRGIVKVHDLIVDGGNLALVMELVGGSSLAQLISHEVGPMPWERARPIFEQLLDAVEYAHAEGVVHRDLKPENVMLTADGEIKILDFGIAKDSGGAKATATGTGMGTVDYMAPEQHIDASNVDARADIYALGMTLYEMLAGRLPWGAESDAVGVLHRKLSGDIPLPTTFYPAIPAVVVEAVMGALAASPDGRTSTVDVFRRALVQEGAQNLVVGVPEPVQQRTPEPERKAVLPDEAGNGEHQEMLSPGAYDSNFGQLHPMSSALGVGEVPPEGGGKSDSENPFAPPQAELKHPEAGTLTHGERSLEDAMAGNWSITPSELFKQAWELKDGAKALCIGAVVISGFAGAISLGLSSEVTRHGTEIESLLTHIMILSVNAPLWAGMWRIVVKRAAGGNPHFAEMFGQFGKVVPLCIGSLILLVATYVGFALLILPGIYVAIAGALTIPLISERGLAPMDAFKTSLKAIRSHFFDVLTLYFLTGLVVLGGVLALGIGLIWALPTVLILGGVLALGIIWALPTVLIVSGLLYLTIFGWADKG